MAENASETTTNTGPAPAGNAPPGPASAGSDVQNTTVSSDARSAPAPAPPVFVDDATGEDFSVVEDVPGFQPQRAFEEWTDDISVPEEWDQWPHLYDGGESGRFMISEISYRGSDADDRVQVGDIASPPWRWLCQLVITRSSGTKVLCTGWLAAPHIVITCGGAVFDHATGWAREVEVFPGLSGARRAKPSVTSHLFKSVQGWTEGQQPAQDYGCIVLPDDRLQGLGHFGLVSYPGAGLLRQFANNAGYPGDKPRGTQWFNAWRIIRTTDRMLFDRGDGCSGHCGSPVWLHAIRNGKPGRYACGLYGSRSADGPLRFTADVVQKIDEWTKVPRTNGAATQ